VKLFLGIPARGPLAASVAGLSRELQQRASGLAPSARLSWVPADRFHLTVLFIGHVDDETSASLGRALTPPLAQPAFEMTATGAGVFPATGRPRVIWAGFSTGRDAFARLQQEVLARIATVVPLEPSHDAQPHITLARVKDAAGLRAGALLEGRAASPLGTLRVDAVTLFESRPAAGGVEYLERQRVLLAAAG